MPTLAELSVLLRLLARSATGQKLSSYTTLITGPRRPGEQDGPEELHVVVLDNGRSNLRGTRYEEMLGCIRCGACLNVCPVYRKAGGGAYGPVYSGPMGAVLVPLLVGLEQAPALPHASSLCGACTDACPVKIPLHELLLDLRSDLAEDGIASRRERLGFTLWSLAWSSPLGYRLSTSARPARAAARGSRRARPRLGRGPRSAPALAPLPGPPVIERFADNARAAGFVVHRGAAPELPGAGVSRALCGLADTGSVVLAASPDEPRARSLLPEVHVSLLREADVLPGSRGAVRAARRRAAERARDRHGAEPQRRHRAAAGGRSPRPGRGPRGARAVSALPKILSAPPVKDVPAAIERFHAIEAALPANDGIVWFTRLYRSVTEAVAGEARQAEVRGSRVPRAPRRRVREPLPRRAPRLGLGALEGAEGLGAPLRGALAAAESRRSSSPSRG